MAQGFKPSKAGSSSKSKTTSSTRTKTGPKRGPRVIAPRKQSAVTQASQKKKQQASLTQKIESDMAGRAAGGGPLTIMKKAGDATLKAKQDEFDRKMAKTKAKGRPQ